MLRKVFNKTIQQIIQIPAQQTFTTNETENTNFSFRGNIASATEQ